MALKQIKNKIISTKKTGKVTKAMEAVSAVKMRKSQERAFLSRPFVHAAMRILSQVAQSEAVINHPLTINRDDTNKVLLVVITSDKGLAGSVSSAVLKKVERYETLGVPFDIIAVGRKAVEFAQREKITVIGHYTNVSDGVTLADVNEISEIVIKAFRDSRVYKKVEVVYQNFISTFEQAPTMRQILPLDPAEVYYIMRDIKPRAGKFSEYIIPGDTFIDYVVEPDAKIVFDALIPQLVQIIIFHAFIESKACEHSARMVAMKNATDKSREVTKALTLVYNKARQAAITAEVAEITGGMEAMKK